LKEKTYDQGRGTCTHILPTSQIINLNSTTNENMNKRIFLCSQVHMLANYPLQNWTQFTIVKNFRVQSEAKSQKEVDEKGRIHRT
jgi:hypothetical protein